MKRALVLGGGGPIGIAWEAGLLLGLEDEGIDLRRFDHVIGTSAGSIVGTHLAIDGTLASLYASQSTPLDAAIKPPNMAPLMAAFTRANLFHRSVAGRRRSLGRSALRANVEGEAAWLRAIAGFLPPAASDEDGWPDTKLTLTAIDISNGELILWTRTSGVRLCEAVASSCAVPCVYPLVHINGRTYMDGGMGSPTNALLAEGCELVVILDPLAHLFGKKSSSLAERATLTARGSQVVRIAFSDELVQQIGMNLMDAGKRGQVAEGGRQQGRAALQQPDGSALRALLR